MPGLVRAVWEEPRPPGAPGPVWPDRVLVGVIVAGAVLEGLLRRDLPSPAFSVLVTAGLAPMLLWRRTRPLLVVAVVFGVCGLVAALTRGAVPQNDVLVYVVILPYALLRWGSGREIVLGSLILVAKLLSAVVLGDNSPGQGLAGAGVLFGAGALGVALRYRALARARELEQARLLERERLARDLHDSVAHHVSAIAIRAQAGLAAVAAHPDAAADALRLVEGEATRALAEMRALVRVLRRNQPAEVAPGPRIADLEQLTRASGGPVVDLEISGDLDGIPDTVGTAIYRLAQESVTNARRHARHATCIEVRVSADETSVRLLVSDDGDAGPGRVGGSPGYGLIGMIERAGLLGGTCEAGPNPGRGWTVTAVLPRAVSTG